jgi:hypothetical protein
MRTLLPLAVLFALAAPAVAETNLECARLPNGGKLTITVPGAVVPPACQVCEGPGIPANPVFGFSDRSRATCELKTPDGANTGVCKKDTTCPPGTTRVTQAGLWNCQSPATTKVIDCPAPPKPPGPTAPPCTKQLKELETRLQREQQTLQTQLGPELLRKGTATGDAAGQVFEGVGSYGAILGVLYGETLPLWIRQAALCQNVDSNNATAVADCKRATGDLNTSAERGQGFATRLDNALRGFDRSLGIITGGDPRETTKTALTTLQHDLSEAQRQVQACISELGHGTPPPLAPRP